jgi:hypothetical protein
MLAFPAARTHASDKQATGKNASWIGLISSATGKSDALDN